MSGPIRKKDSPKHGQRLRLTTPTIAIQSDGESHKTIVTIPMGGIVEVADGQIEGDRLMDVQWEGRTVMMFAQDLRARGEELV